MMITRRRLNVSRSPRSLLLLEKPGLDPELVRSRRDPLTSFAPPGLNEVQTFEMSPVNSGGRLALAKRVVIARQPARKFGQGEQNEPVRRDRQPRRRSFCRLPWLPTAHSQPRLSNTRLKEAKR